MPGRTNKQGVLEKTSNSSLKTHGAATPLHSNYLEVFLRFRRTFAEVITLRKLQRTNSSPNSNCWHSKSSIFILRNINYNINSLLRLFVGTHIMYIYIYIYIYIFRGCRRQPLYCFHFNFRYVTLVRYIYI